MAVQTWRRRRWNGVLRPGGRVNWCTQGHRSCCESAEAVGVVCGRGWGLGGDAACGLSLWYRWRPLVPGVDAALSAWWCGRFAVVGWWLWSWSEPTGRMRGRGCTWEERDFAGRVRCFVEIPRFFGDRQDELRGGPVGRPGGGGKGWPRNNN